MIVVLVTIHDSRYLVFDEPRVEFVSILEGAEWAPIGPIW